jgi:hypothetical protein
MIIIVSIYSSKDLILVPYLIQQLYEVGSVISSILDKETEALRG